MNRSRVIRSPRLIQSQPLIVVWERRRLAKDSCTGIWSLWALVSPGRLWENRDVVQRRHVHRLWRNASLPRPSSSLSLFFCQAFFFSLCLIRRNPLLTWSRCYFYPHAHMTLCQYNDAKSVHAVHSQPCMHTSHRYSHLTHTLPHNLSQAVFTPLIKCTSCYSSHFFPSFVLIIVCTC